MTRLDVTREDIVNLLREAVKELNDVLAARCRLALGDPKSQRSWDLCADEILARREQ